MSWVATAIVGTAVVGGVVSSNSANKAADAQTQAANSASEANIAATNAATEQNKEALAEAKRQYDLNRSDQAPYMRNGLNSANMLQTLMGLSSNVNDPRYNSLNKKFNYQNFTGKDLTSEPGYQFGLQQGQQGLDRSAAARGGYYSGAQLKAASRYNNDYAGTKYNDAYTRFTNDQNNAYNRFNTDNTNTFNRFSGIAGTGQVAANQVGSQGTALAGQGLSSAANNGNLLVNAALNNGNNTMAAGNARASGYVGSGNALSGALGQGINWYNQNNLLNGLNGYSGAGGGTAGGTTIYGNAGSGSILNTGWE